MSHTVTVTRTTATTTATTQGILILNVGYLKTLPGILKLAHVVLGIITVSLLGHYIAYHKYQYVYLSGASSPDHVIFIPELFFLLIATTCLITSTILLFSCLISIATATIIPKSVLEVVYHLVVTILLLIAASIYLYNLDGEYQRSRQTSYSGRLVAAILGIINSVLYGIAVFFANRSYRSR